MIQSKTTTVNTTELGQEDLESILNARFAKKGWEVDYVWETGRSSRQPRLKVIRSKTTTSP
jgi:hypothetical protein